MPEDLENARGPSEKNPQILRERAKVAEIKSQTKREAAKIAKQDAKEFEFGSATPIRLFFLFLLSLNSSRPLRALGDFAAGLICPSRQRPIWRFAGRSITIANRTNVRLKGSVT